MPLSEQAESFAIFSVAEKPTSAMQQFGMQEQIASMLAWVLMAALLVGASGYLWLTGAARSKLGGGAHRRLLRSK